MAQRFFLDQDSDSHWFIVPLDKKDEWRAWRDLPDDDEDGWEPPDFAERLNGSPNMVSFANPELP